MHINMQADGMKPNRFVRVYLVIVLILALFNTVNYCEESSAAVLPKFYVDDDAESSWYLEEDHFNCIQDAIDNASNGDRIFVYAGTYSENIVINDSAQTSISLFGEDKSLTTINGGGASNVITISVSGVDISSFTLKNCGSNSEDAVIKINASNCVVTDNIITNSGLNGKNGIYIYNCSNTKVYYNTITSCKNNGIHIENSSSNEITYCTINSHNYNGIFAYSASDNSFENCNIKNNNRNGIHLNMSCDGNTIANNNISSNSRNAVYLNDHCDNNHITNNDIYSNRYSGIRIENSSSNNLGSNTIVESTDYGVMIVGSNNQIHNSTIKLNSKHGIFLFGDNNNKIADNTIKRNSYDGIKAHNSTSDTITRNEISRNSAYGVYLNYYTTGNTIYNNYFHDNTNNAFDMSENHNNWNQATNSIGNYWDDFDENSEGAIDSNDDGIIDSAKSIDLSSIDNTPISDIIPPVIDNVEATPYSQAQGSYTYISAQVTDKISETITDSTEIKDVRLVITNPNGITTNFTILQNNSGNIYYCNKQFSLVGNYTYYIAAKDPKNWASNSLRHFNVHESNPPSVTDNSPESGNPDEQYTFNVTVTSGDTRPSDLEVYVIWDHGTTYNQSMTNVGGNYFERIVKLGKSISNLTYHFFATDRWGNTITTSTETVTISDSQAPTITVDRYGPSFNDIPKSHTFIVTATDNSQVERVYMEYWHEEDNIRTAEMDNIGNNQYKKKVIPTDDYEKIYCVIYAVDDSGNTANTKNPYALDGGPYTGSVLGNIIFNASSSFDLDGSINQYSWDFGDGSTGIGVQTSHIYSTRGTYTVELTITDNDGNTDSNSTVATIDPLTNISTSAQTLNQLDTEFNINLNHTFYCLDTDGDENVDSFEDPNNILQVLHDSYLDINNQEHFLLSINENLEKNFLWKPRSNEIINVTYELGDIIEDTTDENNNRIVQVEISKTDWVYFEVEDRYPSFSNLTIKREDDSIITTFWRTDNKIFVLDDPSKTYNLIYQSIPSQNKLDHAEFYPSKGSTINKDYPTIRIQYNQAVSIDYAEMYRIKNDGVPTDAQTITTYLKTDDSKNFTYTFPSDLPSGQYSVYIHVEDKDGLNSIDDNAVYIFESYAEEKSGFSWLNILIALGGIAGGGLLLFLIFRLKKISFQSFIYFKDKKLIPFFKPVVFGPLKINIDNNKVSKAEFYVNGQLKETISKEPYEWLWNEPAFLKHNIETKVYDQDGNSYSSGEMTFYMFNPTRSQK